MKQIILTIALLLALISSAGAQEFRHLQEAAFVDRSVQIGTAGNDVPMRLATDGEGNIYVVGHTEGVLVDDDEATNAGGMDIWLGKFTPDGEQVWITQFGSEADDFGESLAVDEVGNIYVAGATQGELEGTRNKCSRTCYCSDAFIAKFDGEGNRLWMDQFGGLGNDIVREVVITDEGNVVVGGSSYKFLSDDGSKDMEYFLACYDAEGQSVWSKAYGSEATDFCQDIALGPDGTIYLVGNSMGPWAEGDEPPTGAEDAMLIQVDADGEELFVVPFTSEGSEMIYAINVDIDNEEIMLFGQCLNSDVAGPTQGGRDNFVIRTDLEGNIVWSDQISTPTDEISECQALGVDADGNVLVAGATMSFMSGTIYGSGGMYLVLYDANGEGLRLDQIGPYPYQPLATHILPLEDGRFLLAISSPGNWGGDNPNPETNDIMLVWMDPFDKVEEDAAEE